MDPIRLLTIFRDKVKSLSETDRKLAAGIMGEIINLLRDSVEEFDSVEESGGVNGTD